MRQSALNYSGCLENAQKSTFSANFTEFNDIFAKVNG
jgi:hypothetical protein